MTATDKGGTVSLALACWRATNGDPELALLLALDFDEIAARAAKGAGTKGSPGGVDTAVNLTLADSPGGTSAPGPLSDREAA